MALKKDYSNLFIYFYKLFLYLFESVFHGRREFANKETWASCVVRTFGQMAAQMAASDGSVSTATTFN